MVRYALEQLRGVGLVARVFLGGSAGRRGLADEYRLTVPDDWLDELEALSPDERTPATSAAVPPPEHRHSVPEIGAGTPATSAAEKQEQRHSATGTPALSDTELRHSVPTTKEYTKDVHHPGNNSPSGGTAADAPSRAGECEHGEPRGPKSCALCRQDAARADAATAEWDRALT